jgi:hypothetical protein
MAGFLFSIIKTVVGNGVSPNQVLNIDARTSRELTQRYAL